MYIDKPGSKKKRPMDGKPAIENKGSMDVYCFMTVETPVFPAGTVALEADEPANDHVIFFIKVWTKAFFGGRIITV